MSPCAMNWVVNCRKLDLPRLLKSPAYPAYLKLVNRIAPYDDQGTPPLQQIPESDG